MDVLNNINTIVSLIAGLIAIGTAIASVLSKRKSVQHALENPSTPTEVRLHLEEQWNGPALWTKIVTGVIKAGLAAVFSTIVVTFVINFFLAFQTFLQDMKAFSQTSSYSQAQNIFSQMLSVMGQIFMFSNPVSLTIGIIVGLLFGILAALSTVNRHMPARVYRIYGPPPYGSSYR